MPKVKRKVTYVCNHVENKHQFYSTLMAFHLADSYFRHKVQTPEMVCVYKNHKYLGKLTLVGNTVGLVSDYNIHGASFIHALVDLVLFLVRANYDMTC